MGAPTPANQSNPTSAPQGKGLANLAQFAQQNPVQNPVQSLPQGLGGQMMPQQMPAEMANQLRPQPGSANIYNSFPGPSGMPQPYMPQPGMQGLGTQMNPQLTSSLGQLSSNLFGQPTSQPGMPQMGMPQSGMPNSDPGKDQFGGSPHGMGHMGRHQGKGGNVTYPGQGGQPQMGKPNNYPNTVGSWDNSPMKPQSFSGKGQ